MWIFCEILIAKMNAHVKRSIVSRIHSACWVTRSDTNIDNSRSMANSIQLMQLWLIGKMDVTASSHLWQAISVWVCLQARRSERWKWCQEMWTMHSLFTAFFFFFWVEWSSFLSVKPRGRRSLQKMTAQIVVPNPAWIAKSQQCELEMSAWNTPADRQRNVLKLSRNIWNTDV